MSTLSSQISANEREVLGLLLVILREGLGSFKRKGGGRWSLKAATMFVKDHPLSKGTILRVHTNRKLYDLTRTVLSYGVFSEMCIDTCGINFRSSHPWHSIPVPAPEKVAVDPFRLHKTINNGTAAKAFLAEQFAKLNPGAANPFTRAA